MDIQTGENIVKWILINFLILIALLVTGCSSDAKPETMVRDTVRQEKVNGAGYTDISVKELETMLDNKDFTFVNVHIPFEGNIPQTDLSIPYDQIESHVDQLPKDKGARIVLYCRSGSMSSTAAKTLVSLGYTNVLNLSGGFNAWQNQGNPLEGVK